MSKNTKDRQAQLRRERRKRRKRNQRIAYIVLFLVVFALVAGGFFGGRILLDKFKSDEVETEALAEPTPEPEEEPEIVPEEIEVIEEPTVEPTPEVTQEDLMDEMVENIVAQMTLEEKVAGIFIISPESLTKQGTVTKAGEGTKAALEQYPVGGIVYSKKNITGVDQFKTMVDTSIEDCRYPLFIAVDDDGFTQALAQKGISLPSAKEMGDAGDTSAAYENYKNAGIALDEMGINLELGPVADIDFGFNDKNIGDKAFGTDATVCATYVTEAVKGLSDGGVWCCAKNFPGQGSTAGDTYNASVASKHTESEFQSMDYVPFRSAIEAGVEMLMVGHFTAESLTADGSTVCSMSKEIMTDIVRGELAYNGVIITDAMNVPSISNYYASDEVAVKALKAGADMILMPEDFELAYNGVLSAVQDGTISEERLNDALKRIYKVKYENALLDE